MAWGKRDRRMLRQEGRREARVGLAEAMDEREEQLLEQAQEAAEWEMDMRTCWWDEDYEDDLLDDHILARFDRLERL